MKTRGFTLLELLIVISIIGVLVGLGVPALFAARTHSKEKACITEISTIETALGSYESKWGDYPPSGDFMKPANPTNSGVESLVVSLFATGKGGPYLDLSTWESHLSNYDADDAGKTLVPSAIVKTELFELTDEFRNPFVYFHNRDFARPGKYANYTFQFGDATCTPGKSAKTGAWNGAGKYQLWSCGSNDKNDDGGDGDLASWH